MFRCYVIVLGVESPIPLVQYSLQHLVYCMPVTDRGIGIDRHVHGVQSSNAYNRILHEMHSEQPWNE